MPLHFQNGTAIEKLVPASTKTVRVMGPQAVPETTLHDILVHLAAQGVFENLRPPESATSDGMLSDAWNALAHLGDASWVGGHDGFDKDLRSNARRWMERYCRGLSVPARADPKPATAA